jgi:hypothetical protein
MRLIVRHQAWEQSRHFMSNWGLAQLLLGPAQLGLLIVSRRVNRAAIWTCGGMIVLAAFSRFAVLPELAYLGRALDFAYGWTVDGTRFRVLGSLYAGVEILKFGLGCGLAAYLFSHHSQPDPRKITMLAGLDANVGATGTRTSRRPAFHDSAE